MNHLERHFQLEELLGHTAWMESLARRLLSDADGAEDVVQETWLAFFRRPPRDHRASVSWLRRVIQNLALRKRMAQARRASRERRAAKPESCRVTPAQMLEQAEIHRMLVDEVLRMDEPYRSTVLLRFFWEMTVAEIAAQEAAPFDTVKTRLRRGIEQLRERLDRAREGRERWMAALAPLCDGRAVLSCGSSGAAGAGAAGTGTCAGSMAGLAAAGTTLGGIIVTQKAILGAGIIGAVALAVGFGVGKLVSPLAGDETKSRRGLVPAGRLEESAARLAGVEAELQKSRGEAARAREESEALSARLAKLDEELDAARKAAAAGVSKRGKTTFHFGKYGELAALQDADWAEMAEAAHQIGDLFAKLSESMEKGLPEDPDFKAKLTAQNAKLVKPYANFMGQISTNGSGMNGEFTHPLILSNLLGAMLDRAGTPFDPAQAEEVVRLGTEFEGRYERLQAGYDASTPNLEKFMDELELKQETMRGVEGLMTPEQREAVIRPAVSDTVGDVTSPMLMAAHTCKELAAGSWDEIRGSIARQIGDKYDLPADQVAALGPAFDAWMAEIRPNFPPGKESEFLRLEHAAIAGRAQANLYKRILALPDLSDKVRQMVLAGQSWFVPHVIAPPANG